MGSLYLDLLEPLRQVHQRRLDGELTREDRCAQALSLAQQGARVALISSGDSGIYGMAGLALELWLQQDDGEAKLPGASGYLCCATGSRPCRGSADARLLHGEPQ